MLNNKTFSFASVALVQCLLAFSLAAISLSNAWAQNIPSGPSAKTIDQPLKAAQPPIVITQMPPVHGGNSTPHYATVPKHSLEAMANVCKEEKELIAALETVNKAQKEEIARLKLQVLAQAGGKK
jgi:hypothetical protein